MSLIGHLLRSIAKVPELLLDFQEMAVARSVDCQLGMSTVTFILWKKGSYHSYLNPRHIQAQLL